jgi:putative phage-type endonuclease
MRHFTVIDAVQRSDAWFAARLGRLTGSRACDMLATIKSGEAAARRDYRLELVLERLTGQRPDDSYINAAMQRGVELEPKGLEAYQTRSGLTVERTGFLSHTEHMAGCSLDGHIGDFAGILEIKCPRSANHLAIVRAGEVPTKYLPQITHNLWISGAAWCDFLTFDPRFPSPFQAAILRVERDEAAIAAYEAKVLAFLREVENELAALRGWSVMKETA